MYSSGIILFEMFHPFLTQMERYKVIDDVRKGSLPPEIQDKWPDQVSWGAWLKGMGGFPQNVLGEGLPARVSQNHDTQTV